ncbi:hypothetical protein P6709_19085 [Jeotgalibacillus sp. ET6]|uniref:hypothetical protein n=1 Tax=Jeotgalibacillus sp. ET6 TaxID=3037260 RepID=UPI002418357C|nr:hypothetical protein [Jeotgalibacillus sp. ET6]MDG5473834.1 hypothetical protein [Jeotgalibacillus sp. ET6]
MTSRPCLLKLDQEKWKQAFCPDKHKAVREEGVLYHRSESTCDSKGCLLELDQEKWKQAFCPDRHKAIWALNVLSSPLKTPASPHTKNQQSFLCWFAADTCLYLMNLHAPKLSLTKNGHDCKNILLFFR